MSFTPAFLKNKIDESENCFALLKVIATLMMDSHLKLESIHQMMVEARTKLDDSNGWY